MNQTQAKKAQKKAIVLLSGGLDSATVLALALRDGFAPVCLSFRYGQRHNVELAAAQRVANANSVSQHIVIDIDLRLFGGSALTGDDAVPKDQDPNRRDIPITYVPARNTIFLSYALALAEVNGARDIFIGVNAVDYSGYPDCRPEFIEAFEKLANLATKAGVEDDHITLHAPLINLTKAEIIRKGTTLGVDYGLTHSCYDPLPDGRACGHCDSCQLRRQGFAGAGLKDPLRYAD